MTSYLTSAIKQFQYYKQLADQSIARVSDEQLNLQLNEETNSIAIIMSHLAGNMLSRWTDFKTTDGEKAWRERDREFESVDVDRKELLQNWELGWNCLFAALASLDSAQLEDIVYIRNQGQTVVEAINRQIAHYSYHVGQIVLLAKYFSDTQWETLSIAKNKSIQYNEKKFETPKKVQHFTDEYLQK
jgi:hypothetical protein